MVYAVRSTQVK